MFKFITHRPLWLNILVGILLAVGIFSIFILSLNWLTHHNSSKTVPQVTGKSYQDAEKILKNAGFDVEVLDSIYTDTTKAWAVLKQFPEADEVVKINRKVYLTINRAVPPMIEMPNLVGYSVRNAEMTLKNAGLKMGDTTFKPDFAKNSVLEQRYNGEIIPAGTKIRMGSKVDFVLGDGIGDKEFPVPIVVGMTFADAKEKLAEYGISFAVIKPNADVTDTMNAYIYRQEPQRFNDEKKIQFLRSGQTMDVFLQIGKPSKDSVAVSLPDNN